MNTFAYAHGFDPYGAAALLVIAFVLMLVAISGGSRVQDTPADEIDARHAVEQARRTGERA